MNSFNISEAFGEVDERFVAEELDAGVTVSQENYITAPSGRECSEMTENNEKKSRSLWLRGGIAAAAVIVLAAGNIALLYSLGKIGRGGSSQMPLTTDPAETTVTTADTTESVSKTTGTAAEIRKVEVPNFEGRNYDEAVTLAKSRGLCLEKADVEDTSPAGTVISQDVTPSSQVWEGSVIKVGVSSGVPEGILDFELRENGYCVVKCNEFDKTAFCGTIPSKYKGLPVTEIADGVFCDYNGSYITVPNSITKIGDRAFSDTAEVMFYGYPGSYAESYAKQHQYSFLDDTLLYGEYHYQVIDNSVYRVEDNKKLFTVDNPQQYLESPPIDTDSVTVRMESITNAGEDWSFVKCNVEDCLINQDANYSNVYFWYNEKTGALKQRKFSAEEIKKINAAISYDSQDYQDYIEPWDNVGYLESVFPDPDGNAIYTSDGGPVILRIPVPGKGELSACRLPHVNTDCHFFVPLKGGKILVGTFDGMIELNMANHSQRSLQMQYNSCEWWYTGKRYICLSKDEETEYRLLEFFPDSNSFRIIADLDGIGYEPTLRDCTDEEARLTPWGDHDPFVPDYAVSLKDGKITELPL